MSLSEYPVRWLEVTARGNITSGFWQPCADMRYPQPNHWSLSCGIHKIPSKCTSAGLKSLRKSMKCITVSNFRYSTSSTCIDHEIDVQFEQSDLKSSVTLVMARSPARWHESSRWARAWSDRASARALPGYNTQLSYSTAASHQLAKSLVERGFDNNFTLVQLYAKYRSCFFFKNLWGGF